MKVLRLLLVFLLAASSPLWADGLPDAEDMTTGQIVSELSQHFRAQQNALSQLQTDLSQSALELEESKRDLTQLRGELKMQQNQLASSLAQVTELKSYLPNLLEEQQRTISRQNTWLIILSCVAAGLAIGVGVSMIS